jgi:hypothetical protein
MTNRINYVAHYGRQHLRERLKQEALANAERDLSMAAEWFPLEEKAWQRVTRKKTGGLRAGAPLRAVLLPAHV